MSMLFINTCKICFFGVFSLFFCFKNRLLVNFFDNNCFIWVFLLFQRFYVSFLNYLINTVRFWILILWSIYLIHFNICIFIHLWFLFLLLLLLNITQNHWMINRTLNQLLILVILLERFILCRFNTWRHIE